MNNTNIIKIIIGCRYIILSHYGLISVLSLNRKAVLIISLIHTIEYNNKFSLSVKVFVGIVDGSRLNIIMMLIGSLDWRQFFYLISKFYTVVNCEIMFIKKILFQDLPTNNINKLLRIVLLQNGHTSSNIQSAINRYFHSLISEEILKT